MYETFAKLLEERNLTAYQVSKATGLSPVLFSEWKKGKSNPKVDKLMKLAEFFEVPLEVFLKKEV